MKRAIVFIIAVIVIGGGVLIFTMNRKSDDSTTASTTPTTAASANNQTSATTTPASTASVATITYDGKTFTPSVTTVASGSTVTIKNASDNDTLDFDSDPHPTHTDDSDLNVGEVALGQSKTFVVTKKGSFGFHNHEDASQHGNIVIQ